MIPAANKEIACVADEDPSGSINLDVSEWQELQLDDDCSVAQSVEVDVSCIVESILGNATSTAIRLKCTAADEETHLVTLEIGSPALRFAVCESDVLHLRYRKDIPHCFNSHLAFVIRDESSQILAASFEGYPETWFAPLEISLVNDGGCPAEASSCSSRMRTAVRVSSQDNPGGLVYDGTRRVVHLASNFIVQTRVDLVKVWDNCEDFSRYRVDLVRADP